MPCESDLTRLANEFIKKCHYLFADAVHAGNKKYKISDDDIKLILQIKNFFAQEKLPQIQITDEGLGTTTQSKLPAAHHSALQNLLMKARRAISTAELFKKQCQLRIEDKDEDLITTICGIFSDFNALSQEIALNSRGLSITTTMPPPMQAQAKTARQRPQHLPSDNVGINMLLSGHIKWLYITQEFASQIERALEIRPEAFASVEEIREDSYCLDALYFMALVKASSLQLRKITISRARSEEIGEILRLNHGFIQQVQPGNLHIYIRKF